MNKKDARKKRALRSRSKIKTIGTHRLCVHRSAKHIYAQLIAPNGSEVICSASSADSVLKKELSNGGNVDAAKIVGSHIAERAIAAGIKKVAFDRSGFKFHGRIKALADAARDGGLDF